MRSIWKGSISFGLVNVPVKLFGATEDHKVECHQVHDTDHGRIRYRRFCEECGEEVEYKDIAKGYPYGETTVVLTDDDLSTIAEERHRIIDVVEFVPAEDLDPLTFDKPYYVTPDNSEKAYKLLTTAVAQTNRVAIVKFALRGNTRLAALRVVGKRRVLVIQMLLWPDEVREPEFPVLDKIDKMDVKPAELALAHEVIRSMHNEFNPDRYRDDYQAHLRELVAAKAEGQEVAVEDRAVDTTEVDDLLAKLRASIVTVAAK